MSDQATCGDVWCDLRGVDAAGVTEGWREGLARAYGIAFDVRPGPAPGEPFAARAARWSLGSVALVHTAHGPGVGRRGTAEIRAADTDVMGLLYLRSGRIGLDFDGRDAMLRAGEMVLWDGARRGAFMAVGPVENHTLVFSRSRLRSAAPGYEEVVGRPFPSDQPAARLMGSFLVSLTPVVGSLDPAGRSAVADATIDLARALIAPRGADPQRQNAALVTAVRLYIDEHVDDPNLSPATIARANAISVRTLHRLFQYEEASVGAIIREARLNRCHADLLSGTDERITGIAFRWGFRNMSFFSRIFRERYGVCPRDVQTRARSGAAGPEPRA